MGGKRVMDHIYCITLVADSSIGREQLTLPMGVWSTDIGDKKGDR